MSLTCLGERLEFITGNGRPQHIGVHMQVTLNTPGLSTAPNFFCIGWISHCSTYKDICGAQQNIIQGERHQKAGWSPAVVKFWFRHYPVCLGGRGKMVFKEENTLSSWVRTVRAPENKSFQAFLSCASLHIKRWTVGSWSPFFSSLFPDALSLNWNSDMEGSCKKANAVVLKESGGGGGGRQSCSFRTVGLLDTLLQSHSYQCLPETLVELWRSRAFVCSPSPLPQY